MRLQWEVGMVGSWSRARWKNESVLGGGISDPASIGGPRGLQSPSLKGEQWKSPTIRVVKKNEIFL